ncbi:hypothetical protein [Rhizobium bangladeshense]|uniref:hypothetical protein n=1 Tax=Rhizobium bangladeshense TaxID=1138189 RepID=UPI001C82C8C4|nr:hypothetical protein [Rhizobium bangladeshense]MBX4889668.1 hypothetical protein [Rhizobium bangladeshense]
MPDKNKGGVAAPPSNYLTRNGSNNSVSRDAGKPAAIHHNFLIEEILPDDIPRDGTETDCPRCMVVTMRMLKRITQGGYLIEDNEEFQRIMHDASGGDTLHVRPHGNGRIVRFYCRNCKLEGYHDRNPNGQRKRHARMDFIREEEARMEEYQRQFDEKWREIKRKQEGRE